MLQHTFMRVGYVSRQIHLGSESPTVGSDKLPSRPIKCDFIQCPARRGRLGENLALNWLLGGVATVNTSGVGTNVSGGTVAATGTGMVRATVASRGVATSGRCGRCRRSRRVMTVVKITVLGKVICAMCVMRVWVGGREEGVPALGPWVLQSLRGHTIHRGLRHRHTIQSALRHAVPSCALLLRHLRSVLHQHIRHHSVSILCCICQCSQPLRTEKEC